MSQVVVDFDDRTTRTTSSGTNVKGMSRYHVCFGPTSLDVVPV